MKIVKIVPGTQNKFTVQKYKDELERSYSKIDLYLCKGIHAEKKKLCTSEYWFEGVISPNTIHDNTIFTDIFFHTTLTNQDGNFELEPPTNYETRIRSKKLENAKPAAISSTVPIV